MVIPKYLDFYSILSIQILQMHPKHYKKGVGVVGMVQFEFLETKLQNFVKIAHFCALGQKRVTGNTFLTEYLNTSRILMWSKFVAARSPGAAYSIAYSNTEAIQ